MPVTLEQCAEALATTHRLQQAVAKVLRKIDRAVRPFRAVPANRAAALPEKIRFKIGDVTFAATLRGDPSVAYRRTSGEIRESFEPADMQPKDMLELAVLGPLNQNVYDQAVMAAVMAETRKVTDALADAPGVDMDALGDKPLAEYSAEFLADLTVPR